MPIDKLKHPNKFPVEFRIAVANSAGSFLTAVCDNQKECLLEARRFRCFLKSLAQYPLHPNYQAIKGKEVKTRVREIRKGKWGMFIHVNSKINWEAAIIK